MSFPEYPEKPSISILKPHELLEIFALLDFDHLKLCRQVCLYWNELIRETPRLNDRFCYRLELNSGTVVAKNQLPFSFILSTKFKVEEFTLLDDFLEVGKSIVVVEANREKLNNLSEILNEMNFTETVSNLVIYAKDDEIRTNTLLFEFLLQFKNIKTLSFSFPAFAHIFERISAYPALTSVKKVVIFHETFRRVISTDFQRLLKLLPNTEKIEIFPSDSMLLDKNIISEYAYLIKIIAGLEYYTIKDIMDIPDLKLEKVGYCDVEFGDSLRVIRFLQEHPDIKSANLALDCSGPIFDRTYDMITHLNLTIDGFDDDADEEGDDDNDEPEYMFKVLKYTPNLENLIIKCEKSEDHNFGHKIVELKKLENVEISNLSLECLDCCSSMLMSCVNVKMLTLGPCNMHLQLSHIRVIAFNLKNLEYLAVYHEDVDELENHLEEWPSMPKLEQLILNKVGNVSKIGIENLKSSCPRINTLRLYSMRGPNMPELIQTICECFPNIINITLRGGRLTKICNLNEIFVQRKGWRLKSLDVSPNLDHNDILQLFKQCDLLESVSCLYGALIVNRRIYYEVDVLKSYTLSDIVQPLKNRKRLHLEADDSSDSETSDSEESSNDDISDFSVDENDIVLM
uniref:CSON001014 protein n=1 Tax=Culicoides sonorensis TaxID=179676 RepID=A0A336KZG6_CULSO